MRLLVLLFRRCISYSWFWVCMFWWFYLPNMHTLFLSFFSFAFTLLILSVHVRVVLPPEHAHSKSRVWSCFATVVFHNLDFECACSGGFTSRTCTLFSWVVSFTFILLILSVHVREVLPPEHAHPFLECCCVFIFMSVHARDVLLREHARSFLELCSFHTLGFECACSQGFASQICTLFS